MHRPPKRFDDLAVAALVLIAAILLYELLVGPIAPK